MSSVFNITHNNTLRDEDFQDPSALIIPPPPTFSSVATPDPRYMLRKVKTSTPISTFASKTDFQDPPAFVIPPPPTLPALRTPDPPHVLREPRPSTPILTFSLKTDDVTHDMQKPKELPSPEKLTVQPTNITATTKDNKQAVQETLPTNCSSAINEELLATIVSTMDKIIVSHDLPSVKITKFDGSPENYLRFRQRFKQIVESRPLNDAVKVTRLLQFLEGPALLAVQQYETLPGGLEKAMKVLEDRFGRPYQIVKACVDTLTKGPVIQPSDKQGLQQFADVVQATYETLATMETK